MKKFRVFLKFIDLIIIFLGVIVGGVSMFYILERQHINSLFGLFYILLIMIISLYTSVLIHEIGHIIGFKAYGCQTLLTIVGPIVYTNSLARSIKVNFKTFILGAIIPKVKGINLYKDIHEFTKALKLSLCLGPIMNLITAFIIAIYIMSFRVFSVYLFYIVITSTLMFFYSMTNTFGVKGDLYILSQVKHINQYTYTYLFKYSVLNNNTSKYLEGIIEEILKNKVQNEKLEPIDIDLLSEYIDYCTANKKSIPDFINEFMDSCSLMESQSKSYKEELVVILHKFLYNKVYLGCDLNECKKFYNEKINANDIYNNFRIEFYKARTKYILKIDFKKEYLAIVKNIYNEMMLEYLLKKFDYIEIFTGKDLKVNEEYKCEDFFNFPCD